MILEKSVISQNGFKQLMKLQKEELSLKANVINVTFEETSPYLTPIHTCLSHLYTNQFV